MLGTKLKGNHLQENLDAINKVINIPVVKKYPSYIEIPSFWQGGVRDDYYDHLKGYNYHVYSLFLENPKPFLENRVNVFLNANSFGSYPVIGDFQNGYHTSQFYNPDQSVVDKIQDFYAVNKLSEPINLKLKQAVTKRLMLVNDEFKPTTLTKFIWTVIPTLLALLSLFVVTLWKRQWLISFVISLLLAHTLLIFLTAPASYFMYYFPIYLVGNFLVALFVLKSIKLNQRVIARYLNNFLKKDIHKIKYFF
jgi:hypothetical protein